MRDTKIVYIGIIALLLLPLLFYGIKCIIKSKKEKDFKYLYYRLAAVGLMGIAVTMLFLNTYRFTLGYQAPLVAEQFIEVEGYADLKELGFNPDKYSVFLSENIYENDDGTITIYSQFESEGESIYTIINMKNENDQWEVLNHEIISGNDEDYPETKKRFYPIR